MCELFKFLTNKPSNVDYREIVISISELNVNQKLFRPLSNSTEKKYILIYIEDDLGVYLATLSEIMDMRENTEQCRIYNVTQKEIDKVITLHSLDIKLSEAIYEVILKDKELIFLNYGE